MKSKRMSKRMGLMIVEYITRIIMSADPTESYEVRFKLGWLVLSLYSVWEEVRVTVELRSKRIQFYAPLVYFAPKLHRVMDWAESYVYHSNSCRLSEKVRRKWEDTHPQFCHECNGVGYFIYEDDPSPSGVSLSAGTMTFSDFCEVCVGEGYCPWCLNSLRPATEQDPEPGFRCSTCEWTSETPVEVTPVHECYCWENEIPDF